MRFHPRRCVRKSALVVFLLFGTLTITKWRRRLETPMSKQAIKMHTTYVAGTMPLSKSESTYHHSTKMSRASSQFLWSLEKPKAAISLERLPSRILILVYTLNGNEVKWVGENREECNLDATGEQLVQCPLERFELTYDKQRFKESNLVVFHSNNMPSKSHLIALSNTRPTSQRWVYHTMESPKVTPDPVSLKGLFNATWTYRSDSEFSAAYATYVALSPTEQKAKTTEVDFAQGKLKLVAWMVSNCGPKLRIEFVKQLQKYIDVDVYGRCSHFLGKKLSCPKSRETECLKKYKFYLAFENAFCKDYITEKYWDRLGDENVVPVVMGGLHGDYSRLAIPGSYINALDFRTVKELGDHLHYLDGNNTAYNEYFKWRRKFRKSPYHYPLCNFCKSYVLKPELSETKTYHNLRDFWVEKGSCDKNDQVVYGMLTR